MKKIVLGIIFLALLIGLFDSIFLTYKYITADPINCFVFDGCNVVAGSSYSKPFGIPLPIAGIIFNLGMMLVLYLYLKLKIEFLRKLLIVGAVIGFLASLYFTYLQGFVIQAFCIYCLISAVSTVIVLCGVIYFLSVLNIPQTSETAFENEVKM